MTRQMRRYGRDDTDEMKRDNTDEMRRDETDGRVGRVR